MQVMNDQENTNNLVSSSDTDPKSSHRLCCGDEDTTNRSLKEAVSGRVPYRKCTYLATD